MPHFELAQPCVGAIHIEDNDSHVLKPAVITAGIRRSRPALGCEELRKLNELFSQAQSGGFGAQSEDALQMLLLFTSSFPG